MPLDDARTRRLKALEQLEQAGLPELDYSVSTPLGEARVTRQPLRPLDIDNLDVVGPVSALGQASGGRPVAPEVPADPRDLEMEQATALDEESMRRRLFETATRQLVGGLTRTAPQATLTQETKKAPELLAKRRQAQMDALRQVELGNQAKRFDYEKGRDAEKFAYEKDRDTKTDAWRQREADENQEIRREGIAASREGSEAMRAIAGANLGLGLRKEARDVESQAPKAATELRKEFNQLPEVKQFGEVSTAFQKVKAAASDPSAAGDLSAIFAYMKMLDPGSSVREGEFANAQNAGGIDTKIVAAYNNVRNGQRLTPEQRADFINQAERLFQTHKAQYDGQVARYRSLAERNRTNPDDVIAAGQATTSSSGPVKMRFPDGSVHPVDPADMAEARARGAVPNG